MAVRLLKGPFTVDAYQGLAELGVLRVAYDRDVKLPLYARAEIPEAWLVNMPVAVGG